MAKVYITGHRNPDLDSVCSAFALAKLKNLLNDGNEYEAVRCGHLSETVKKQLSYSKVSVIPYLRNVYPKVSDVMFRKFSLVNANEPVYNLIQKYNAENPSAFPVFDEEFIGLLSVDDITSWFLKDNSEKNPKYDIPLENINAVLPGKFLKKGKNLEGVSILAGAAALEEFRLLPGADSSILVLGMRKEIIEEAIKLNVSAIVITTSNVAPDVDFSNYQGSVYLTDIWTSEAIRRLRMAVPVKTLLGKQGIRIQKDDLFEDAKQSLIDSKLRGLSVFDADKWVGFVTRRCFLNKPSYKVILVDHNEVNQSIKGIEQATVCEIVDHHRLDALKTELPINVDCEPLGSTCTIVYLKYRRYGFTPDIETARALLTGIISDTLILRSPTTTEVDRRSAYELAQISGILDLELFGKELFACSENLSSQDPETAVVSDFKQYSEKGVKFGVGQCEATTLADVSSYSKSYLEALEKVRKSFNLDWTMLMITDVIREKSVLLVSQNRLNSKLPFAKTEEGIYEMPGIMSRKKQLLPEIIHVIGD